jgi:uncharacterized membrane-anchored protein
MKCVPKIDAAYWTSLSLASVFGANAGDFIADVVHLGHLSGIPYLAGCLTAVFIIERSAPRPSALYYWIAIIVIRASATNIGDVFHDFRVGFPYSVPFTIVLLIMSVAIWRIARPSDDAGNFLPVNGFYWMSMFLAGVAGTVGGDAASYGVGLGNAGATLALGAPLALVLLLGRNGLLTRLYYYWFTVALIRAAGTAAGDWLAHGYIGLKAATALSGAVFFAFILFTYRPSKRNIRSGGSAAVVVTER